MTGVLAKLTQREKDVLRAIIGGGTYAAIAHQLGLGYETVKTLTNKIRAKTGATSKTSLAVWAMSHGIKPEKSRCR